MQSKTSYFNKTLFLKNIKRFWPLWALYLLLWFFILVIPTVLGGNWNDSDYYLTGAILESAQTGGIMVGFCFGIMAAMAVWQFLYTPRSASFMASLPIRREGIFLTNYLSAVLTFLACNAVIVLFTLLAELAGGTVFFSYLATWFAVVSMMGIFFFGLGTLTAMLTGNIVVLPLLYVLLNYAAIGLEGLVRGVLLNFVYGSPEYWNGDAILGFLSPAYKMADNLSMSVAVEPYEVFEYIHNYHYSLKGISTVAAYCAVGLVMTVLALLLYRRRKMETASDVVAVQPLRPVFRYAFALAGALIWAAIFLFVFDLGSYSFIALGIHLIIGCFIGYFTSEMIMRKSFRVWRGKWKGFAVSCGVIVLVLVVIGLDLTGYEKSVPELSEVEIASISTDGAYTGNLVEPENIQKVLDIHQSLIDNKEDYFGNPWGTRVYVDYELSGGKRFRREYILPGWSYDGIYEPVTQEDIDSINEVLNTNEAILNRRRLPAEVTEESIFNAEIYYYDAGLDIDTGKSLSVSEALELYNQYLLDADSLYLGQVWVGRDMMRSKTEYYCDIRIHLNYLDEKGDMRSTDFSVSPTVDSRNMNKWLTDFGIDLITRAEREALYDVSSSGSDFPDTQAIYRQ